MQVIPHFQDRASLKRVFSALWQAGQRRHRVMMTGPERRQLDRLPHELGLPLQDR
jgi:isopentenyldiphosphate isomerase